MRSRGRRIGVVAVLGASVAIACGAPRLAAPDYTGQPTAALSQIPYPPPPARVEFVPEQPRDGAVWIDGEWTWRTRRWSWKPGRWVEAPRNARFSPWTTVRDRTGTLYIAAGAWRDDKGGEVPEPPVLAAGRPTPVNVVDPEGETVPQAPVGLGGDGGRPVDPDAAADQAFVALDAGPPREVDASILILSPEGGARLEGTPAP
jgi:hypothetical protein